MSPEEFRRCGREVIDFIADYRERVADLPVASAAKPGDFGRKLPPSAPVGPEGFHAVLEDVQRIILPGLAHWQSPNFHGYFPANSSLSSVLGDLLSTGLGVLGLSWQSGPAITELEECVVDWVRQLVGLSSAWSGVIQDTASTCTLVALICARERTTSFSLDRGGLQGESRPLVVYASAHSHSSVLKAALLAGFGRDNVRTVAHDWSGAMDPEALAGAMAEDANSGRLPCAVVATTGTTATTALDPIEAICAAAKQRDVWVHVDAAMAGSAMILPECRWMWKGVEAADSIVVNAHKWLGAAFDCSLYYVRSPEHLIRVMSTNPSYLQSSADGEVKNLRDWGIPLGRRFRALKLWSLLRTEGVEAIQNRLRRDMQNARKLAEAVRKAPRWRVLAPVVLQTVCLRHEPAGLNPDQLDRHTLRWASELNASGAAYVTPAKLDGRWIVRVSIGSESTEAEHVVALWDAMQQVAEQEP